MLIGEDAQLPASKPTTARVRARSGQLAPLNSSKDVMCNIVEAHAPG
jgi:hypothetical protein